MTITKGDTHNFQIAILDANGDPLDLTSYTVRFIAKDSITKPDTEADISQDAVIGTPSSGIGVFKLLPADTTIDAKDYWYDIQVSDGSDGVYTVKNKQLLTITAQVAIEK